MCADLSDYFPDLARGGCDPGLKSVHLRNIVCIAALVYCIRTNRNQPQRSSIRKVHCIEQREPHAAARHIQVQTVAQLLR